MTLSATAAAPATATFSPSDPTSYNSTTAMTVYDSLGAAHSANLYFVQSGTVGSLTLHTVVDGTELGTGTPVSFDVLCNEIRGLGLNIQLEKKRLGNTVL